MNSTNMQAIRILVATAVLFFLSCTTDNRVTGGTAGSETTNTYALTVVDSSKIAVPGASVRIVSGEEWLFRTSSGRSIEHYEAQTDHRGKVFIPADTLPDKSLNLLIDAEHSGFFTPSFQFTAATSDKSDTIRLERRASLTGTMEVDGIKPDYVLLKGTDYSAEVSVKSGDYHFPALPPGAYNLIAVAASDTSSINLTPAGSVTLHEGEDAYMNLSVDFSGITVDDFDGDINLMSLLNTSLWYIVKDGDISVMFPEEREDDTTFIPLEAALVSQGAYEGRSLHLRYSTGQSTHFLIVGAQVSKPDAGFSHIDEISFRAKGNGRSTLRLHGKEEFYMPAATCEFDLDTIWQRYTFMYDDFSIADSANDAAVWSDIEHRISWIAFHPGDSGSEFWLDDVRLNGVSLGDLIAP